jgi:hypothetical protein
MSGTNMKPRRVKDTLFATGEHVYTGYKWSLSERTVFTLSESALWYVGRVLPELVQHNVIPLEDAVYWETSFLFNGQWTWADKHVEMPTAFHRQHQA